MAIRTILHYPDPRLREKARPVEKIDDEVRKLLDDMAETMYAAPGCGLAATQIGVNLRVFIIDTATNDEPSRLTEFINPEIIRREGSVSWEEGCLSFPNLHEEIKRAQKVTVRALDRNGNSFDLEAEELLAVAVQHENDHLNGELMIDKLGPLRKRMAHRKMIKQGEQTERALPAYAESSLRTILLTLQRLRSHPVRSG
jgi:peptide deformylase